MPQRLEALNAWLYQVLDKSSISIAPASSDASFRRYFRVEGAGDSLIAMDAPPDREDTGPFVHVANLLATAGVNAPRIIAADPKQGFLLLTDLGHRAYLDALSEETVDSLYGDALTALHIMQRDIQNAQSELPPYSAQLLLEEMNLFRDWYLRQQRQHVLSAEQQAMLDGVFAQLVDSALEQPRAFVHRDYHSRNLMVTEHNNPGILDFQDAVYGPISYDLVSLLRDCYVAWPRERVEGWALNYFHQQAAAGLIPRHSDRIYLRWFDWMGVQRHLKASGIFARLNLRDNKPGYLADIPRTLGYVQEVTARYPELRGLHELLCELAD
jgi:aminoglycoside/choline kinase family phosphotransferase